MCITTQWGRYLTQRTQPPRPCPVKKAPDRRWSQPLTPGTRSQGGLWSLHEDSGQRLPRQLHARQYRSDRGGQGLGTHVQNVHALPEAVVEGVELHGQVLRHLGRAGEGRLRATTPEGAPAQPPCNEYLSSLTLASLPFELHTAASLNFHYILKYRPF